DMRHKKFRACPDSNGTGHGLSDPEQSRPAACRSVAVYRPQSSTFNILCPAAPSLADSIFKNSVGRAGLAVRLHGLVKRHSGSRVNLLDVNSGTASATRGARR